MQKLTAKQQAFVDFLLTDPEQNQTKAYLYAYPKSTLKAAEVGGSKMVRIPKVQAALTKARSERAERTQINADWLLNRLADESEADIADLFDQKTGALKPVNQWPKIWRQGLVAGFEVTNIKSETLGKEIGQLIKVKLSERSNRLKMIGDHIGVQAFKQQVDHTTGGKPLPQPASNASPEQLREIVRQVMDEY
jgi:phage terminase small subunit